MLETEMGNKQYEIIRDEEQCIIRLNVYGQLEKDVGEKIITEARTQAAENQFNILCDVRQAKVNVAFIDWFYLPRNQMYTQKLRPLKQQF